jgi:hypothetical protein
MPFIERHQDSDNRVPRLRSPGCDQVPPDFARESIIESAKPRYLVAIERRIGADGHRVEDAHVLGEAGNDQIGFHLGELASRHRCTSLDEHFEPHAKPIGIELFVHARMTWTPEVDVEDPSQLVGCRQRHDLAAIFESAPLDDPVKHLRLEPGDDLCEVWDVQDAI